ncbi:hypothetical protein STHERM_c15410 [Spirochaeta thermophila DSM 6192]|uniref:Lipoprotein n=2 Tax=Winmispira thermophila TaxID=154 RepID=E0RTV6_WINT6|nr:hypothetical protein STHERM_c15410 [Spirochaeta thermophila DSM 6192]
MDEERCLRRKRSRKGEDTMKHLPNVLLASIVVGCSLCITCITGPHGEEEWVVERVEYSTQYDRLEIILANVEDISSYDYFEDAGAANRFDFYDAFSFSDGKLRIQGPPDLYADRLVFFDIDPPLDQTTDEGISLIFHSEVTFYKAEVYEFHIDMAAECHFKDQAVPITFVP